MGNNISLQDLKSRKFKFEKSANAINNYPKSQLAEFAFLGRSNVGKSSLINSLTLQKSLARTSKTPGRTQLINFFNLNDKIRIVDLPGYGYAKESAAKIAKWNEFTFEYILTRENLKTTYILIDSRHGIKSIDFEILNILTINNIDFNIILTKSDKTSKTHLSEIYQLLEKNLSNQLKFKNKIFLTSSLKNIGLDDIRKNIIYYLK